MPTPKAADSASADTTPAATYPIRAVSLMTGVAIDTLRAWERRYNAVTPKRDGRGRVYSDVDVHRIRLLYTAVNKGYAIGRVASYTTTELEQLPDVAVRRESASTTPPTLSPPSAPPGIVSVASLLAATERFDAQAVEHDLARAAAMLPTSMLLRDLVVPALNEIGMRWHDGAARIAHEHLLSASVRNVLGSLLRLYQKTANSQTLLFATPSGEPHELGALGAAVLAANLGLGTIYLGPGTPAEEVLATIRAVRVQVVVLGVVGAGDFAHTQAEVAAIASQLPSETELWIGGPGAERFANQLGPRPRTIASYDALETQLQELVSRPRQAS